MSRLYEIVELTNGDIALQREGDTKAQPLVTMRFSTELLRFLQGEKIDIAKTMIEAGLEHVAELADAVDVEIEDITEEVAATDADPERVEQEQAESEDVDLSGNLGSHLVH